MICVGVSQTFISPADVATAYPDKDKLLESKGQLCSDVLHEMLETPAVGLHGPACRDLVLTVIESSADKCYSFMDDSYKRFVDALEKKQFCLPSVLLKEIQSTTEDILTDCDFRKQVVNDLPAEESFLPAVINTFFVEFIFKLGSHILSFIKKCVVDRYPPCLLKLP